MEDYTIHIKPTKHSSNKNLLSSNIVSWLPKKFIGKLFLALFLLIAGIGFTLWIVKYGWESGVLMLLIIVALPIVYFLIISPQFGILTYLSLAYTIMWFARFTNDFPVGTIMDGMLVFFILGFFIKQKTNASWLVFKNPISLVISIWILYNIAEGLNPVADSVMAWLYAIRTVAIIALLYFIFLCNFYIKALIVGLMYKLTEP